MRSSRATLALWGLLVIGTAGFGRCGEDSRWRLTWADEFDGAAGDSPDATRWGFDVGTGWGNNQLEYDTPRPVNASLDGAGNLVITARQESYSGSAYTSARMLTRNLFAQRYGRFEARIKLPRGQGLWPAFWMMGTSFDTAGWPACGEIDVMEYRGQEPGTITGSLHMPGNSGGTALTGSTSLPAGAGFDEAFHVYALEWTPDWIAWELDGKVWQVIVPAARSAGSAWPFDQPFFILLNLAVGGNYVGAPDPSVLPQTMLVDWVRVYEKA